MKTLSHLVAVLLLTAATAQAQTVYRCGNSYSQQPCPGGSAVRAEDSRTPDQRRAAADNAKQQRRTADVLEKQRIKDEAAAARMTQLSAKAEQAAAAKRAAQQEKAAQQKSGARGGRHREPRYFTARDAADQKSHQKDAPSTPAGH